MEGELPGMLMLHSAELDRIPMLRRYFWLARAYLEGSRVLCQALIDDEFSAEYTNTRVILHLARQAVELFLKGAIAVATDRAAPNTHRLDQLEREYERLFPAAHLRFVMPFGIESCGSEDPFPEVTEQYHKTLDQRYRYPGDRAGNTFDAVEGFIPAMFLNELEVLRRTLLKLEHEITRGADSP